MSIYVFGDSFVGPFTLVKDANLKIYKFKGATMRGLTKDDNKNRLDILDIIKKQNNKINCMIFNFGQVDLYFSYYYTKFVNKKKFMVDEFIKEYVQFINSIDCKNCNKIIFGVYPHVVKDEHVFDCLISYGILTEEIVKSISDKKKLKLSAYGFRCELYSLFNILLKKYCDEYNIIYINFEDEILDKDKKVKSEFIDSVSKYNIHLLWDATSRIKVDIS
jgi:hypothetical protein